MITINGTGFKYLGFSKLDKNGCCTATKWLVFAYFPLFPLKRHHLKFSLDQKFIRHYQVLGDSPSEKGEIISTYLWGWILIPLIVLAPLIVTAVLTENGMSTKTPAFSNLLISGIIWAIISVLLFYRWDQMRGLPGKKTILGRFLD